MKVFIIIPAAGLGTRMSGGKRHTPSKQFTHIGGTPILIRTLRCFGLRTDVDQIIVALRENEIANFKPVVAAESFANKVKLVAGGENRQDSVYNALSQIEAAADDVVLVHDGVRPFAEKKMIADVIAASRKYGAAIAGVPALDTIKLVERSSENAVVTSTIPRERVVMAQTPQGARFAILREAFASARADGFTGTDEASLIERAGHTVGVVMGSYKNIKITTPADIEIAEMYARAAAGEEE